MFPDYGYLKGWRYEGEQPKTVVVHNSSSAIEIKKNDESILLRFLRLKNEQARQQQKEQKPQKTQSQFSLFPQPIHKMTLQQLKESCKKLGLKSTGTKQELAARLEKFTKKM